jgi:hypothetical protein
MLLPGSKLEDSLGHARLLVMQSLGVCYIVLSELDLLLRHAVKLPLVRLPILNSNSYNVLLYRLQLVILHL